MKPKHQRLILIFLCLFGLGIATFLTVFAFRDSLVFFYTPSDIAQKGIPKNQRIRIGGLVALNSIKTEGEHIQFIITDEAKSLRVSYIGLLPDLFKEGQGVVAEGYLIEPNLFNAETVLAKHDENYMPKEVADRLKKEGLWRDVK